MQSEIPEDVMTTAKAVVDRMPTHAFKGDCVADVASAIMAHAALSTDAEPVKTAPAVAVKRIEYTTAIGEAAQGYFNSFGSFKVHTPGTFLFSELWDVMQSAALTAQVQDVAGTVEMVENCVLFSTPGEYAGLADHAAFEAGQDNAIRTVVKLLRDNLPAAPAKQEGKP